MVMVYFSREKVPFVGPNLGSRALSSHRARFPVRLALPRGRTRSPSSPPPRLADERFELPMAVCNGRGTAAERNRCREFAVNRTGAAL
jgi:hypothetical protein